MPFDRKQIEAAIEVALRTEAELPEATVRDIAFHMTDWLDDLRSLQAFYDAPANLSTKEIEQLLIKFLVHAPNHLAAACKLLTDIPVTDIFGVGATSESDESEG